MEGVEGVEQGGVVVGRGEGGEDEGVDEAACVGGHLVVFEELEDGDGESGPVEEAG